jgi:hypothetical protein
MLASIGAFIIGLVVILFILGLLLKGFAFGFGALLVGIVVGVVLILLDRFVLAGRRGL